MFALRRFASAFALCALFLGLLAVTVQAASVPRYETNAQRMARGLAPLRPKAFYPDSTSTFLYRADDTCMLMDRAESARRSSTSSKPATYDLLGAYARPEQLTTAFQLRLARELGHLCRRRTALASRHQARRRDGSWRHLQRRHPALVRL
jgi:hypothetical protein